MLLKRGAKPAPVPAQAIGPFSSKGVHYIVVVVGDPALKRITVDLEVALQANGVDSDPKHLLRAVQRGTQQGGFSRKLDAIAMPMQHQAAAWLPLEQWLITGIRDPVDRAEAQFLQLLRWCSHLQGLLVPTMPFKLMWLRRREWKCCFDWDLSFCSFIRISGGFTTRRLGIPWIGCSDSPDLDRF